MTAISERQRVHLYVYIQETKTTKRCIYKNPDIFQKSRLFALRFYIQKVRHFTLRDFS